VTLKAEGYYVNIHSTAFGAGEIRGQIVNQAPSEGEGEGEGGATFLGSHTAPDNVLIDGALLDQDGVADGPGIVNYTGTEIEFAPIDFTAGSFFALPDENNNHINMTGPGAFTVVFTALEFDGATANQSYIGMYFDEQAPDSDDQVGIYITPDGGGGFSAFLNGAGPNATPTPESFAVTLPITTVLTRTESGVSATANGIDLGTSTRGGNTDLLYTRVLVETPGNRTGIAFSVSSIDITGVGIPDVNQGPAQTEQDASVSFRVVAGDSVCFDVTNPGTAGTGDFTWTFDDGSGAVTLEGVVDGQLCFEPLTEADAGTYVASFDDGDAAKGENTFTLILEVLPEGTAVPASTNWTLFITMLAVLLSGAALMYGRKKGLGAKG
jgi:hypothetical protein